LKVLVRCWRAFYAGGARLDESAPTAAPPLEKRVEIRLERPASPLLALGRREGR